MEAGRMGAAMHELIAELYPICRSITGDGVRETLRRLQPYLELTLHEVPSGTPVLDWMVPREWNIRDAYVKDSRGTRVIDFRRSNLHVMSYSAPLAARMSLTELRPHLHSLPEHPHWIPYRTSYYEERWGFCLSHADLLALAEDEYEVRIDATLENGSLTYGEACLPGETEDEVLISCHICHPSLCNDNLSGIAVAAFLGSWLRTAHRQLTYRFLFIPGTIGSITWLARHEASVTRIAHGLVLANLGDPGPFTYKRSRRSNAAIDRVVAQALRDSGATHEVTDFVPWGYDERQYCSPGFNLPMGCLSRTPPGRFPEYHTSADDLSFVRPESLAASLEVCLAIVDVLEHDRVYVNQSPRGEPQLGRRGLYRQVGGGVDGRERELALLWVLNQSDGEHSLLDIATTSGLPFPHVRAAAEALVGHGLLKEVMA